MLTRREAVRAMTLAGAGLLTPARAGDDREPVVLRPKSDFDAAEKALVSGVAWHPDGKTLAVACDFSVRLWDAAARKETAAFRDTRQFVNGVAWRPDGKTVAAAGEDEKRSDCTTRPAPPRPPSSNTTPARG